MAKKKTPVKKTQKKNPIKKIVAEPKADTFMQAEIEKPKPIPVPQPLLEITYQDKRHILLKGVTIHLFVYMIIAITLAYLNVPAIFIFLVMMVLLWGLFVISYAFYKKNQ